MKTFVEKRTRGKSLGTSRRRSITCPDSSMPYHAAAISADWQALTAEMRTMFLALLDVAGAGWSVTDGLVLALVVEPLGAARAGHAG